MRRVALYKSAIWLISRKFAFVKACARRSSTTSLRLSIIKSSARCRSSACSLKSSGMLMPYMKFTTTCSASAEQSLSSIFFSFFSNQSLDRAISKYSDEEARRKE